MVRVHNTPMTQWRAEMYANLVYSHHAATKGTLVRREFYTENTIDEKGKKEVSDAFECDYYIVRNSDKDTDKYALTKDMINDLPIKVNDCKKLYDMKSDEVVYVPTDYHSFRIKPERLHEFSELVKPFLHTHSNPKEYEQHVVTAFSGLLYRQNYWISAIRAYGKSSIFKSLNLFFDNVEVREGVESVPAFYKFIPAQGIMVLDEMKKKSSDSAEEIWYVLNQVGDRGNDILRMKTGGSPRYGTHVPKAIRYCSFVCLFNRLEDYTTHQKFAEFMFTNNESIDRRYLKLKLSDGKLDLSQFAKVHELTESDKKEIIKMNKSLRYYAWHLNPSGAYVSGCEMEHDKELVEQAVKWLENAYTTEHHDTIINMLKTYSVYCKDDTVRFTEMVFQLRDWILDYKKMVGRATDKTAVEFKMVDDRGEQPEVEKVVFNEADLL